MLTVCIPVYNHSFIDLTISLHQQCTAAKIPFEIIVSDDNSSDKKVEEEAKKFQELTFAIYHRNKDNIGNDLNRNLLAELAHYPWLLFLDADTMPLDSNFVSNYINVIHEMPADVYSGGIVYDRLESKNHILKWKHGKKAEEITKTLNADDYLGFRGNNFLIKKSVFLQAPFVRMAKNYGYIDTVFGINLKLNGYCLKLIHNPVIHLGLMDSKTFINKTHYALENAIFLEKYHPNIAEKLKIIRALRIFKKLKLVNAVAYVFSNIKQLLYRQLLSKNPKLFIFQLYKLGYLCYLDSQQLEHSSKNM